ncbi:MAG TPA: PDZ domain-containing protein [Puia sp.]|nr:PDZ domain-containing protein [Puia sp.]
MKQYLLKASGIAMLALMLHSKTIAQDTPPPPPPAIVTTPGEVHDDADNREEIIIRKKNNKDIKITVEVKEGKVFINGKPADEYNDDNVSIRKMMLRDGDGDVLAFASPDIHFSPFRGGTSYKVDGNFMKKANVAFLGVTSNDADDDAGAKITGITEGSAAEKAQLRKGDIITKINDIKVEGSESLTDAIHTFKPEEKVTVTFKREGKEQKVTATLGKNKGYNMTGSYNFSMPDMQKMKELSNMDRLYAPRAYSYSYNGGRPKLGIKAQDTEDGKGVKVLDVDDESPAEKAGVKEGDVITQFDGKPVNSAESLANLARENKDKYSYKLNLTRDGKSQEVEVKIPKKLKTADL